MVRALKSLRKQDCGQVHVPEVAPGELTKTALCEALDPFLSRSIVYFRVFRIMFMVSWSVMVVAGGHVWYALVVNVVERVNAARAMI